MSDMNNGERNAEQNPAPLTRAEARRANKPAMSRKSKIITAGAVAGVVGFVVTFTTLFYLNNDDGSNNVGSVESVVSEEGLFTLFESNTVGDAAAESSMVGGFEYAASDSLDRETTEGGVFKAVRGDVESTVRAAAEALNVPGEYFVSEDGVPEGDTFVTTGWGVMVDDRVDYSQPYITASYSDANDAPVFWNYSSNINIFDEPAVIPEPLEGSGGGGSGVPVEVDENGNITNMEDLELTEQELAELEAQISADFDTPEVSADEEFVGSLKTETVRLLTQLGYNSEDFSLHFSPAYGFEIVAEFLIEGEVSPLNVSFYFNDSLEVVSASGYIFNVEKLGDYDVVSAYDAATRANSAVWFGMAPASMYGQFEDMGGQSVSVENMDAMVLSDYVDEGVNALSQTGNINDFVPEPESEAFGIIVQYVSNVTPTVEDNVITGFETVENSEGFTLGEQVGNNLYIVNFPTPIVASEVNKILTEVGNASTVEEAYGDWFVGFTPVITETETVTVDKAILTWVMVNDVNMDSYITRGYYLESSDSPYVSATVSGVPESLINIESGQNAGLPEMSEEEEATFEEELGAKE